MNSSKKIKIGIFDSGLGGLTVFKSLANTYRNNTSFIYLGDLAHLPYGDKSQESIIKYSQRIVDFFIKKKVDIIIVACNSASSVALNQIKCDVPIIGTIQPSVQSVIKSNNSKLIGIIGTDTTINSKAYNRAFEDYNNYTIYSVSCPLFVPIVEEGWENTDIAHQIAAKYLNQFQSINLDTIILACTHYPMLLDTLKSVFKKLGHHNLYFIDSGKAITQYLSSKLSLSPDQAPADILHLNDKFYITDTSYQFNKLANRFLGTDIPNIELITL